MVPFGDLTHTHTHTQQQQQLVLGTIIQYYLQAPDNVSVTVFSPIQSDHPCVSSGFSAQILIKSQINGLLFFLNYQNPFLNERLNQKPHLLFLKYKVSLNTFWNIDISHHVDFESHCLGQETYYRKQTSKSSVSVLVSQKPCLGQKAMPWRRGDGISWCVKRLPQQIEDNIFSGVSTHKMGESPHYPWMPVTATQLYAGQMSVS